MAGIAGGGLAATLASIFATATPVQLGRLGNHLSQSSEMQALLLVDRMQATPALAPMLFTALSTVPNLPPQVLSWVEEAVSNPAESGNAYGQAKAALMTAAVAPGVLGNLGL